MVCDKMEDEMTKIMKCYCKNSYQDKIYGKGKRVFNSMFAPNFYRCTVCGQGKKFFGGKEEAVGDK
jgi:hypothetical protein